MELRRLHGKPDRWALKTDGSFTARAGIIQLIAESSQPNRVERAKRVTQDPSTTLTIDLGYISALDVPPANREQAGSPPTSKPALLPTAPAGFKLANQVQGCLLSKQLIFSFSDDRATPYPHFSPPPYLGELIRAGRHMRRGRLVRSVCHSSPARPRRRALHAQADGTPRHETRPSRERHTRQGLQHAGFPAALIAHHADLRGTGAG